MNAIRRVVVLLLAAAALPACAVNGLDFFEDERLSIISPSDGEEVDLPLEVAWRAEDFDGLFAVFFDTAAALRPGEGLASLAGSDDPCHRDDTCGDEAWLAARNIYVTDGTSLTVDNLPDRSGARSDRDQHELVIVLLDASGKRVSEASFHREIIIERGE